MHDSPLIRRCRRCGEAAVVPGHVVRNTSLQVQGFLYTQLNRCQSCGRRVPLCSRPITVGIFVAGVLLSPILVGLPLVVAGWWLHKQAVWNPVVPDAPVPPQKYRNGPRQRTCGTCGGACEPQGIKRQLVGVLPAGATVFFQCEGCGAQFSVENLFGLSVSLVGGLLLLALAVFASLGSYVGAPLLAGGILLTGAIFAFWTVFVGIRVRVKNRVRPDGLLR